MLKFFMTRRWLVLPILLAWMAGAHATEFSTGDYDLYVGDFNHDGRSDLLYIGKTPDKPSGIALADVSGTPQMGFQSWPSNYLNIPWSSGAYKAVIGDFNGDGCSDIFLQTQAPGTSYVLLANCNPANGPLGRFSGISQAIPQGYLGLNWSADQHRILAGDFDGDGKTDLFLQPTAVGGTAGIVLADTGGNLFTRTSTHCWPDHSPGPQQCWPDGTLGGFNWSTHAATVYVGDFNGDGKSDLLIITKPTFVMIDYDVPFPVPKFAPNSNGILLAQPIDGAGTIFQSTYQLFNYNGLGANFSSLISNIVVGDFNGDGYADVLLQSRNSGRSNLILYSAGSTGQLGNATTPASNVADWTGNNYQLLVGKFGNSSTVSLFLQSTSASGSNYSTSNISLASVSATASGMQIAATVTQPANGVGATTGSATVSASGTGRYTIPLSLPRGTAGLTPELALQYQHSGSNGLLGVGWSLSGLSTITRCAQNFAQDGLARGVQYVAGDQYCLDGARLRLTSGIQGTNGSQYHTELESYSLVIAKGTGTNGPASFEVWRKDGTVAEYGNTPDSNIPGAGGTRVWALNKIRDRAAGSPAVTAQGNYITFSYINGQANPLTVCKENTTAVNSYRPCQITYTGNAAQNTAPPYTIQFSYQPRNAGEVLTHNYIGQTITEVNRLQTIQLQYGGAAVHTWNLGYDGLATLSHFSRITSIQECGLNNDCFTPTTFSWSTAQVQPAPSQALPAFSSSTYMDYSGLNYSSIAGTGEAMLVDLNGDGILDTVMWNYGGYPQVTSCGLSVQYGAPHGSQPYPTPINVPLSNCLSQAPQGNMDVDLDGKSDVLLHGGYYLHQKADGTLAVDTTPITEAAWVDVDGDGYPDLVYEGNPPNNNVIYVSFRSHDGSQTYQSPVVAWTAPAGINIVQSWWEAGNNEPQWRTVIATSDFDGDGRGDLLVQTTAGWRVLLSNGSGFTTGDLIVSKTYGSGSSLTYITPVPVDVNGDGCTDLAYPSNIANPTWQLAISKCSATLPGFNFVDTGIADPLDTGTGSGWVPTSTASAVDLNLDGFQDLLFTNSSGRQVAFSVGSNLAAPIPAVGPFLGDRDGDGLPDANGCAPDPCTGNVAAMIGPRPDLLTTATDAFGNTVNFTYAPLTDSTVYTRGQGQTGVTQDMGGPMYVVKQLQSTDGVGGQYSQTYSYQGAHHNVQGRGFLGFASRTMTDSRTGFVTQETYNNTVSATGSNWEFVGTLAHSTTYQYSGGPVLKDIANQWASFQPVAGVSVKSPYLQTTAEKRYELGNGGTPITTTVTSVNSIDVYGTISDVTVATTENSTGIHVGSSHTQHVVMTAWTNDTSNWCLNKPTGLQTTDSHTLTDGVAIVHTVTESWDTAHCRLTDKNLEVGSGQEEDTHYDYDSWNNVWHETVSASNLQSGSRTTTFDYATGAVVPGQLLMKETNAANQVTTYTWDNSRALKSTMKDPNGQVTGLTTSWEYDDFGRVKHQLRPDGTGARRTYFPCTAAGSCGDTLLRFVVQEDDRDTQDNVINYKYLFFDSRSRVKYDETRALNGNLSVVESLYDARGNVVEKSMPYYPSADRYRGTSFTYDLYNRVTQTQRPSSDNDATQATTQTVYNGLTVTYVDALSNSRTEVSDGWGDIIRLVDEAAHNVNYTYDAFSDLKTTTDANGNVTTISYNVRGFRIAASDPDLGTWSYPSYDGLGELLTQTDGKGQQTQFHYDALGRMDKRQDPGAASWDSLWTWDSAANGIGKLGSVTGPSGFSVTYAYDTASRKLSETTTSNSNSYAVSYGYDPLIGKLQTITYPASTLSHPFEVIYDYQYGYTKDVVDYTNQARGTVLWQANAQDARGHITQQQTGDGQVTNIAFDQTTGLIDGIQTGAGGGAATQNLNYSWDRNGNLSSRQDANQGLSEAFAYDSMSRLQSASLNGASPVTVSYDAINNINIKSDVSSTAYNYTTQQTGCVYTGLPAQPHAVRSAGGNIYCYDANGNMTSRSGAQVTWYGYNYPQTINQAGGNFSTFYYSPDRARYRQTSVNGSTSEDRIYVSGLFERLTSSGGPQGSFTAYRHYIVVNDTKVAIKLVDTLSDNNVVYLHDDHLGSTDVEVTVTSGGQQSSLHESYDAWGKRRGSNWTGVPSASDWSTINATSHIGFTGQEHLDNLSLVDLNGRVYDPVIGRFMSADPIVQEPYRSQSLNRYSYTWNNPLNQTDPTGFCTGTRIDLSYTECFAMINIQIMPGPGFADDQALVAFMGGAGTAGADAGMQQSTAQNSPTDLNGATQNQATNDQKTPAGDQQGPQDQKLEEITVTAPRMVIDVKGHIHRIPQDMYDTAIKYIHEVRPQQRKFGNHEHFGRNYNKDGTTVDAKVLQHHDGAMCYDTVAKCDAVDKRTDAQLAEHPNTRPSTKPETLSFNVHLHPGTDDWSRRFSGSDMNLSRNAPAPVFIGNEAGDMQLFLPDMNSPQGYGIDLCRGCAK